MIESQLVLWSQMRCIRELRNSKKKIDNSEMLGIAAVRLKEELRQLKLESKWLSDQLLQTKRLLEYAGNQRESHRRQIEILMKE